MPYEITRLNKSDYDEAIDFINMVFSMDGNPIDFPQHLPNLYQPTEKHMQCHYAIKIDSRIKALLGIYPSEMVAGTESLRLAQIGAVSVHPYYREKGMMSTLMDFAVGKIKDDSFDLACLGGMRERYKHFGFERCGFYLGYQIGRSNFTHNNLETKNISFKPISDDNSDLINSMNNLYQKSAIHVKRTDSEFINICKTWKRTPLLAMLKDQAIGYLVPAGEKAIAEIYAETDDWKLALIRDYIADREEVEIKVNPVDIEFAGLLNKFSEGRFTCESGNWQIFNYEKVLTALLKVKSNYINLEYGNVIFSIDGFGTYNITISPPSIICQKTDQASTCVFKPEEFMRIAFGPQPSYAVAELPDSLKIFNSWFPLPLAISEQDRV